MRMVLKLFFTLIITGLMSIQAFSEGEMSKGVGPITEVKLEKIDMTLANKGKEAFTAKCSACHKIEERYVGPKLKDITKRRSPEWIMNMIMNPVEMTEKDPAAQELLGEFLVQMTFQNVSKDETRSILEYFRASDEGAFPAAAAPAPTKPAKTKKSKK